MRTADQFFLFTDFVRHMLSNNPQASGQDVLTYLEQAVTTLEQATERSYCAKCTRPLIREIGHEHWRHDSDSFSRKCRVASYDFLGTWDDALLKGWEATPTPRR